MTTNANNIVLLSAILATGCSSVGDISQRTGYASQIVVDKPLLRDVSLCPYKAPGVAGLQMLDRPDGYCGKAITSITVAAGQPVSVNRIVFNRESGMFFKKKIYAVGTVSLIDGAAMPFYFLLGTPGFTFCSPWQETMDDCAP